jgi:hypothetical protein
MAAASAKYTLPNVSDGATCTDNTWTATNDLPISGPVHTAVWTGSEMIVWIPKPADAWGAGITEYARHDPFGFHAPSIMLNGIDPKYAAVITIAGEEMTDRSRRAIASETCSLLRHRLGKERVTCFDTAYTQF